MASTLAFAWTPAFFVDYKILPFESIADPHFGTPPALYWKSFSFENVLVAYGQARPTISIKSRWWSRSKSDSMLHDLLWGSRLTGRGWPLICLYSSRERLSKDRLTDWEWRGAIRVSPNAMPFGHKKYIVLPYLPIWPALAVNIGTHSLVWFVLLSGIGAVRSFIRTSRGKCAICAYNVKVLPQCPECGWKRRSRARRKLYRRHSS